MLLSSPFVDNVDGKVLPRPSNSKSCSGYGVGGVGGIVLVVLVVVVVVLDVVCCFGGRTCGARGSASTASEQIVVVSLSKRHEVLISCLLAFLLYNHNTDGGYRHWTA